MGGALKVCVVACMYVCPDFNFSLLKVCVYACVYVCPFDFNFSLDAVINILAHRMWWCVFHGSWLVLNL